MTSVQECYAIVGAKVDHATVTKTAEKTSLIQAPTDRSLRTLIRTAYPWIVRLSLRGPSPN